MGQCRWGKQNHNFAWYIATNREESKVKGSVFVLLTHPATSEILQHLQFPLISPVKQRNCVDVSLPKIDLTVQTCWGFIPLISAGKSLKVFYWNSHSEELKRNLFLFSSLFAGVSNKLTPNKIIFELESLCKTRVEQCRFIFFFYLSKYQEKTGDSKSWSYFI